MTCSRPESSWGYAEPSPVIAFVDVNVVPMDRERILEAQTVLVRGSSIESIGPAAEVNVPPGALRIDGRKRFLMPGLADMHAHVDADADLLLFLANGVTTVRNMAGSPSHLKRRERIARGELIGPTMYTAGPIIDGPPELWPGNVAPPLPPDDLEVITTSSEGRRVVREQAAAGYDFIKVYDNLPAEAFEGVVAAARELGIPVAGHVPFGVGLSGVLKSGMASIEHLRGYIYELRDDRAEPTLGWDKRSRFLAWNHIDGSRVAALAKKTVGAGIWNVPTLTRYQKNMMPTEEHLRRYTGHDARYVNPAVVGRIIRGRSTEDGRYGPFIETDFEKGRGVFQAKKTFVKTLHDSGAGILLGSDDWFAGFATHEEIKNLTDSGLTPYEAIATGTSNAAAFLNATREFGSVAVGLRADLILLEKNPLESVVHLKQRVGVMARGRWHTEAELRKMLDDLAASYRTRTSPQQR